MKTIKLLKFAGMAVVVMSVAAGCASTQQQQQAPKKAEPAPEVKKGPSAAEQACAAAEAARKKAKSVGGEWRDTGKIIKKAEAAMKAGDDAKAIKLCDQARRQGELGYAQALAEQARLSKVAPAADSYTVERGDSLWAISGKGRVYGNPYQWPLLYKANRDIISDADLIYPGQDLTIDRGASSADIDAAIRHAKTRGAWAVGVVEESDKAYLAQ
ncbi:MAG: LysM peptidoglycan-binding domain-containing protein [Granulosicoccaceae bacterium]|jgi:nucleoid-associated protein YgaU